MAEQLGDPLSIALIVLTIVFGLFVVWGLFSLNSAVPVQPPSAPPLVSPAKIEVISVVNSNCSQCTSLDGLTDSFNQLGIEIASSQSVEFDSVEGKQLVEKYGLTKLPALVIKADETAFQKLAPQWPQVGQTIESEKTFVFSNPPPVFFDLEQGRARGIVHVTLVTDSECVQCTLLFSKEQLQQSGIAVESFETIDMNSVLGKNLVQAYKPERIPFAVFSSEIQAYQQLWAGLQQVGSVEPDGNFVFRQAPPLYIDLNSNRLVGKVNLTILDYPECTTCFDANIYTKIWPQAFGVFLDKTEFVHYPSADANKLIQDYNISKIPAAILSGDVNAYPFLEQRWPQLGVIAADQNHIFTGMEQLGQVTFYDLNQGKTVQTSGSSSQ